MLVGIVSLTACDGLSDPATCGTSQTYVGGSTATGKIEASDCKSGGDYIDVYSLTVTEQAGLVFTLTGSSGGMSIFAGLSGTTLDDSKEVLWVDNGKSAKGYFPPGTYTIVIGSHGSADYSLQSASANSNGCSDNFIVRGATTGAAITDADCSANGGAKQDSYAIQLKSGQPVSVTASLLKQGAVTLRSRTQSADLVTRMFDTPGGGTASFNYTATASGWYEITVYGEPARFGASGYSLTVL